MGVVYLATDPLLGRTVAVKILSAYRDEAGRRAARALRQREARLGRCAQAQHIVTIYDIGEDEGRPFIAMEFLDGETMAELIRRRAADQHRAASCN